MRTVQVIDEENNVIISISEDGRGHIKGICKDGIKIFVDGKELEATNAKC